MRTQLQRVVSREAGDSRRLLLHIASGGFALVLAASLVCLLTDVL